MNCAAEIKTTRWKSCPDRRRPGEATDPIIITKTYSRIAEITDSTEPPTYAQRITLATALEQLQQKQTLLKELNLKIANGIADAEELTEEICDTEEYHTALAEKIAYVYVSFLAADIVTHLSPRHRRGPHPLLSSQRHVNLEL